MTRAPPSLGFRVAWLPQDEHEVFLLGDRLPAVIGTTRQTHVPCGSELLVRVPMSSVPGARPSLSPVLPWGCWSPSPGTAA